MESERIFNKKIAKDRFEVREIVNEFLSDQRVKTILITKTGEGYIIKASYF